MEKICCFLEEAHEDDERMPTDFRNAEKQNRWQVVVASGNIVDLNQFYSDFLRLKICS
ncbi:MAG: hypothetical protein II603_00480 [Muribaculaceae bacterium]|jgi:hypothetical protein|nr:hypothetical protein [Muribaculaceae bacterium]